VILGRETMNAKTMSEVLKARPAASLWGLGMNHRGGCLRRLAGRGLHIE